MYIIWLGHRQSSEPLNSLEEHVTIAELEKTCAIIIIDSLNLYLMTQSQAMQNQSFFFIPTSGFALSVSDSDEYKLRRELLKNMDVMVRPVTSSSDAVNVNFSLTVWALVDLVCCRN